MSSITTWIGGAAAAAAVVALLQPVVLARWAEILAALQ